MTDSDTDMELNRQTTPTEAPTGSRLIGAIVAPAVKLWLRSQVESAADIRVQLSGRDRQILGGRLPQVQVSARSVVYQGLQLSAIDLIASEIAVNLRQVLRGQPLRLLQPILVVADLSLSAADLTASLAAPLLASTLDEFLQPLLAAWGRPATLATPQASLAADTLILDGTVDDRPVRLQLGLDLAGPQQLLLRDPRWLSATGEPIAELASIALPLGEDVAIEQLTLEADALRCRGTITVRP
jgi:hypothetical protein